MMQLNAANTVSHGCPLFSSAAHSRPDTGSVGIRQRQIHVVGLTKCPPPRCYVGERRSRRGFLTLEGDATKDELERIHYICEKLQANKKGPKDGAQQTDTILREIHATLLT